MLLKILVFMRVHHPWNPFCLWKNSNVDSYLMCSHVAARTAKTNVTLVKRLGLRSLFGISAGFNCLQKWVIHCRVYLLVGQIMKSPYLQLDHLITCAFHHEIRFSSQEAVILKGYLSETNTALLPNWVTVSILYF